MKKKPQRTAVLNSYAQLLKTVKEQVRTAQARSFSIVNREMVLLYWKVGSIIGNMQLKEGWGKGIIDRLSNDLKNELPQIKGFSSRNLGYMIRFYKEYPILQQPVAKLADPPDAQSQSSVTKIDDLQNHTKNPVFEIPWGHHILLILTIIHYLDILQKRIKEDNCEIAI